VEGGREGGGGRESGGREGEREETGETDFMLQTLLPDIFVFQEERLSKGYTFKLISEFLSD
jgi:hypothetical protein